MNLVRRMSGRRSVRMKRINKHRRGELLELMVGSIFERGRELEEIPGRLDDHEFWCTMQVQILKLIQETMDTQGMQQ